MKRKATIVQSFADFRAGSLPVLALENGAPVYVILNVFTKPGLKRYEAESRRGVNAPTATPTKKGK